MAKVVAWVNLVGAVASIIGLAALYYGQNSAIMNDVWRVAFAATIALSVYVLGVPDNALEKNVKSKLRTFNLATDGDETKLCVQEGEQIIEGVGPLSVRFDPPFVKPPEIEIINTGECGNYIPQVKEVTRFQFVVVRRWGRTYSNSQKYYPDKFGWIATGQVMAEVKEKP